MGNGGKVNQITGKLVVTVADVIRRLEASENRKFTIAEVAQRFREFERIADYVNSPPRHDDEQDGPWRD